MKEIVMNEECLICGAPLEYLASDEIMECAVCKKRERSKTRCVHGHYVCNDCHTQGLDAIVGLCLSETSKDPAAILERMMNMPFCHMHGPEHHVMVGAALLTAYRNAGGKIDLKEAIPEMIRRGKEIPGGACGFWGACGAGISAGMYVSIITGADPLSCESWGLSNQMTSEALGEIAKTGGPRCCKRDSYTAIQAAVRFTREHFGIEMDSGQIVCTHVRMNNQCIGRRCPYAPASNQQTERRANHD